MKPPASWYRAEAVRLAAEVADVRADRDSYREIAQQAIHELARLTQARRRDRERYLLLLAEVRRLRPRQPRPRPPSPLRRAA